MNCFVCAPERLNASGLNLVFEETETGASAPLRLPAHFQSYPGFLHGGILCAVLDETMAYAAVFKYHVLPFTRRLTTQFRGGVRAEGDYVCRARLISGGRERFEAEASIEDEQGRALVQAHGEFVVPSANMAARMMPGVPLDGFLEFFN